eukprot:976865-Amphidinium_carterae.1
MDVLVFDGILPDRRLHRKSLVVVSVYARSDSGPKLLSGNSTNNEFAKQYSSDKSHYKQSSNSSDLQN